ncbi:hypothetical protein AB0E90_49835, partial [Actinoplanes sp. NPDC026619]
GQLHRQGILTHHTEPNEPILKSADQLIHRRALTQAAAVPISAVAALKSLRDAQVRAGQRVLIIGAGGASARSPSSSPRRTGRA